MFSYVPSPFDLPTSALTYESSSRQDCVLTVKTFSVSRVNSPTSISFGSIKVPYSTLLSSSIFACVSKGTNVVKRIPLGALFLTAAVSSIVKPAKMLEAWTVISSSALGSVIRAKPAVKLTANAPSKIELKIFFTLFLIMLLLPIHPGRHRGYPNPRSW